VDGRLIHRMKAGSATWQLPSPESVPSNWLLRLARLRLFIVERQQQRVATRGRKGVATIGLLGSTDSVLPSSPIPLPCHSLVPKANGVTLKDSAAT